MTKTQISVTLKEKRERLKLYLDREKFMLSPDAVQSYGVGSRNLQRYRTDLADIQHMIKRLEDEVASLEAQLRGCAPRKSVGIIPRD